MRMEDVYYEHLFRQLAHEIARFPAKQRQALLADLASRMAFSEELSSLQAAFQAEDIHLEDYRQPPEHSRKASLLAQAHERLRKLKQN